MPTRTGMLLLMLWLPVAVWAQNPRSEPVVVYRDDNAVPAEPYWRSLLGGESTAMPRANAAREAAAAGGGHTAVDPVSPLAMADRLPLHSAGMRSGAPGIYSVAGMARPLFVIGMDAGSLDWLTAAARTLVAIGASGLVVQAPSRTEWLALRDAAAGAGLSLQLFDSAVLQGMYPVSTYPALLVSPELAGQLRRELSP